MTEEKRIVHALKAEDFHLKPPKDRARTECSACGKDLAVEPHAPGCPNT